MSVDFGVLLKNAREEKNISLAQVSETLKLTVDKITEIENSDVTSLPPAAFTCGYLRLFSKLVDADENEIIRIYYQAIGEEPETSLPNSTSDIPTQADIKHPGMRLVSFSVVVMIIILSIVWWNDRDVSEVSKLHPDQVVENDVELSSPELSEEVDVADGSVDAEKAAPDTAINKATTVKTENGSNAEVSHSEIKIQAVNAPKKETVGQLVSENESDPAGGTNTVEIAEDDIEQEVSHTEQNIKLAKMASPVAEVGVDTIQLNALDDCWIEISDDNDHLLYFSLLKKGEEVHLSGQEPFKVFLGKANAVNIKLNDINYDVSSYVRSNQVARFTMSMEDATKMKTTGEL